MAGALSPRRREVLAALTASDLLNRYGRGPGQLVRWMVDPFALVGVYLLLVVFVIDRPGRAPGLSLACAVIPFQLVVMTVVNSMSAVRLRGSIILNLAFDRLLIPSSAALTEFTAFGASLALLAVMMLVYGVAPTMATLLLPLVLAVTLLLAVAFAYPASLFGLWFAELRGFAVSFVRTMFFLAPGLVALEQIPGRANDWVRANPLTGLFESYRDVLLYGEVPAVWQLAYPAGIAILLLAIFVPLYDREQRQFAKLVE